MVLRFIAEITSAYHDPTLKIESVRAALTKIYVRNLPVFDAVTLIQYYRLNISKFHLRSPRNVPSTKSRPKKRQDKHKTPKCTVMHTFTCENTKTET